MALTFRTTGMKKSTRNRIILLVLTFIASLVFFYIILNHRTTPTLSKMSEPTLPVVTLESVGHRQTELFGYREKMDISDATDFVVPLDDQRKITVNIDTYGSEVGTVSLQVRVPDSGRMVSSEKVSDLSESDGTVSFDTQLTNLMTSQEKYELVIIARVNGKNVYYYTPVMITENSHISDVLDFAEDFHTKSLSTDDYEDVAKYLETDAAEQEDKNLSHVTIRSDISDIALNGLSHKESSDPVMKVTDITDDTVSVELSYTIEVEKHQYLANEKYRIRYGEPRMYLLDFDRTLDIIPDKESFSVSGNVLKVGAASTNLNVMTNEAGSVGAFVEAGNLYEYNQNRKELITVFSFGENITGDSRIRNQQHEIRILNVDAAGSMDFVVFGYMNCGSHEGRSGVDLYHYDSSTDIATEEGFIESSHTQQYISTSFSELLYRTPGGRLYTMLGGKLLGIDLSSGNTDILLDGLQDGQYSVSADSRYIAWTDSAEPGKRIRIRDLSSERTFTISAKGDERLSVLCFMRDNLVYGTYKTPTDKYMSGLTIVSFKNEHISTLKEYQKNNIYISGATADDTSVRLTRMRYTDGGYKRTSSDTILDTLDTGDETGVSYSNDDNFGRIRSITLSDNISAKSGRLKFTESRLVLTKSVISIENLY